MTTRMGFSRSGFLLLSGMTIKLPEHIQPIAPSADPISSSMFPARSCWSPLPVHLTWVHRGRVVVSDAKLSALAAERFPVELGAIICDKGIGDSETTNDRSPEEVYDIAGGHGRQRFRFCPLREIVHSYHQEPLFPFPEQHRTNQVHPPF
jgi:hypothetical protein